MPDEKKKISEDPKAKKLEAIKKSKGLYVCTPIHSDVCLHYMKSCLDLQKECLLNNTNITFQLMKSSWLLRDEIYVSLLSWTPPLIKCVLLMRTFPSLFVPFLDFMNVPMRLL